MEVRSRNDGRWSVKVNDGQEKVFETFDEALAAVGNITFAPGESPGSWRVQITER